MSQLIAHVFPTMQAYIDHMRSAFDSGALVVNRITKSYEDVHRREHRCFVIRSRNDIQAFLGFEFTEHMIYGGFSHLDFADFEYLRSMLNQRTRQPAPEVSA
jgi:hypothetical protein